MIVACLLISILVGTLLSILLRPRRPQKPRLEILPHDAGAEAFADQMRIERERRRDRG